MGKTEVRILHGGREIDGARCEQLREGSQWSPCSFESLRTESSKIIIPIREISKDDNIQVMPALPTVDHIQELDRCV